VRGASLRDGASRRGPSGLGVVGASGATLGDVSAGVRVVVLAFALIALVDPWDGRA
jgi:hypothetical protein